MVDQKDVRELADALQDATEALDNVLGDWWQRLTLHEKREFRHDLAGRVRTVDRCRILYRTYLPDTCKGNDV